MSRPHPLAIAVPLALLLSACGGEAPPPEAGSQVTVGGVESELGDLVGVRGSAAETQMQARGYTAAGGGVEGDAAITYWRRGSDGSCVAVRTSDGRYQSLAAATPADCEAAERATRIVAEADSGGYRTVCGVFVDGKPVRYVCSVVDGDQHSSPTTLRFPDNEVVVRWLDGTRMQLEFTGTVPMEGTWSASEGEVDLVTSDKTWFYIADREAAAREVAAMEAGGN